MNIAVLCGGISPERDVSICSACKISNALRNKGYKTVVLDLFFGIEGNIGTSDMFKGKDSGIKDIYNIPDNPPSLKEIREMRKDKSDIVFGPNVLEACKSADVVFIALHGDVGEDGRVQATFDMFGIKYTGSNYISCGIAMDKELSKKIVRQEGILTAEWVLIDKKRDAQSYKDIKFPCVIKPCNGGSSIGVSIAQKKEELEEAIKEAGKYDCKIMVEEYIAGREFSVGVLNGEALPPIEIIPKIGFYDYKNKYQANLTTEICPADLSKEETDKLKISAERVHKAIGLGSYSRADFIRDKDGNFIFLEVNTLPGMTPTSLLPQEAKAVGIEYDELCEIIVNTAR